MQFRFPTLKGIVLGSVLIGIFIFFPVIILLFHFFPQTNITIMLGVGGVFIGLSFYFFSFYWNWADRVMAKLFGSNGDKQEG